AVFAGLDPFFVMAEALGNERIGSFEIFEFFFGEQNVFAVIGEEHPFGSDKQSTAVPFGNESGAPEFGFFFALIPGKFNGGHAAPWAVFVHGLHGSGSDFGMSRRTAGFDGERVIQFERPEGKVVPMAAEIAHGASTEIPPPIPFWPGEVDLTEGAFECGAEPEVPVQA